MEYFTGITNKNSDNNEDDDDDDDASIIKGNFKVRL